ncbi:MAG: hypothetical protein EZS28_011581 [Streblomastix strix]|uniref:Uncharacterized protein n=1 Tax=Streblomastix strix TaxID=222440 RepID=A0A5J4WEB9_9EUKA|nr:MAG: hypothetical protein EZS28_011581 [Streblomastix strix]
MATQNANIELQSRAYQMKTLERTCLQPQNRWFRNQRKGFAQQVAQMAMDAKIKLEPNSQQSDSIDLTDDIERRPTWKARHNKLKALQGKDSGRRLSKQCRSKSGKTWEQI